MSAAKADGRDDTLGIWYQKVNHLVGSVSITAVSEVAVERQIGFLNMFEHLIRVLGHGVLGHIEEFGEMLVLMIASSSSTRSAIFGTISGNGHNGVSHSDDDDADNASDGEIEEEEDDRGDSKYKVKKQVADALKVRKLSILRLSGKQFVFICSV